MNTEKENSIVANTLQKIDGVITAISAYPNIEEALLNEAQKRVNDYLGKFFPTQLDFGKQILEHLVGTDVLINIVSNFLVYYLPEVEVAIKAALLANMNSLADNCTIDPVIYEKAIKEGIVFDLKQIDLLEKLNVSPLDEKFGQYYYFGTEGCYSAYDVLQSAISPNNLSEKQKTKKAKEGTSYLNQTFTNSYGHYFGYRKRDFDCLLWYMKNKAAYREVWGKRTTATEDFFNCTDNIMNWLKYKGSKNSFYYIVNDNNYIIIYSYKDGWTKTDTEHQPICANTTKKYFFHDGTKNYIYSYGNVSTKKLDRNKYYLRKGSQLDDKKIPLRIYYWDEENKIWGHKTPKVDSTDISILISDDKAINVSDCIDISNDLNENLYLFVDYDLKTDGKTNKELIENDEADKIKSSLREEYNTGRRTWNKKKIKNNNNTGCDSLFPYDMLYIASSQEEKFTQEADTILVPPMIGIMDGKNNIVYKKCINITDKIKNGSKYTKKFGILTLEYSSRTGNVKQSDGNPMQQQTPYDNALHVFFGNVKELPDSERSYLQDKLKDSSKANNLGYTLIKNVDTLIKNVHKEIKEGTSNDIYSYISFKQYMDVALNGGGITGPIIQFKSNLTSESGIFNDYDAITEKIQDVNNIIETGIQNVENFVNNNTYSKLTELLDGYCIKAYVKRIGNFLEANENLLYLSAKNVSYPEAKQNYYYFHTLLEFNVDYINSLQLFDEKVLAAQLITSLFGGIGSLSFTANLGATASWKREYIRDTVSHMVEKAIAGEDFTVSDCFFTFSNDSYNSMLQAAELRQAGLYSKNGEENGNNTINIENILSGLNGIDEAASQTEQISIIEGAISSAADKISEDTYSSKKGSQFGISISFIESLITNLCTQMVLAVLSPKVYLLILINLQIFGLTTNFDLKSFIENFLNLIRRIIQSIVNQFIEYLTERIRQYIEDLASKLVVKISFEQVEMYSRLLKQILRHLKALLNMGGGKMGWAQDIIGLADIKQSINDTEEVINEC